MQTISTTDGELYVRDGVIIGRKVIRGKTTIYYKGMSNVIHRVDGPAYIDEQDHQTIYMQNGDWHRDGSAAQIIKWTNGNLRRKTWAREGKLHRDGKPADIEYYEAGGVKFRFYYVNNNLHNNNGPAFIEYYPDGTIKTERWYQDGKLHRWGGPAVTEYNKSGKVTSSEFYNNGAKCEAGKSTPLYEVPLSEFKQSKPATNNSQPIQINDITARLDLIEANIKKIMESLERINV